MLVGFSFLSPVKIPTFPGPNKSENSEYLEFDKAFKGEAYQDLPPFLWMLAIACSAIQVFPAPVGAVTRQSAFRIAEIASNWKKSGSKGVSSGTPMVAKTFFSLESAPGFKRSCICLILAGLLPFRAYFLGYMYLQPCNHCLYFGDSA